MRQSAVEVRGAFYFLLRRGFPLRRIPPPRFFLNFYM
jgi:hypothetical protein